jgi:hypothetical protein
MRYRIKIPGTKPGVKISGSKNKLKKVIGVYISFLFANGGKTIPLNLSSQKQRTLGCRYLTKNNSAL